MTAPHAPPVATWAWLVPDLPGERALVVAADPAPLAAELAAHFPFTTHATRAPFAEPDGRFACVAIGGPLSGAAAAAGQDTGGLLRECRRVLAAGGWLAAAETNPWWVGHALSGTVGASADIATQVRRAGFTIVRTYYLLPSLEQPRTILPATRAAARANETYFGLRGAEGTVRRIAAGLGAHRFLYRSLLVLAQT